MEACPHTCCGETCVPGKGCPMPTTTTPGPCDDQWSVCPKYQDKCSPLNTLNGVPIMEACPHTCCGETCVPGQGCPTTTTTTTTPGPCDDQWSFCPKYQDECS